MAVEIDLRAAFVPYSKQIWRLFPGRDYTYLDVFRKESIVFLDTPGLQPPEAETSLADFNQRVLQSALLKVWSAENERHRRNIRMDKITPRPSWPLSDYPTVLDRGSRTQGAAIQAFFLKAGAGDLIVVPDQLRERRVFIGELLFGSSEVDYVTYPRRYGSERIPGRRVRWFPEIDEGELPPGLSKILRTSNPLISVPQTHYEAILNNSYRTYYREDLYVSTIATGSLDFSQLDGLNIGLLAALAASLTHRVFERVETGTVIQSLYDVTQNTIPIEYQASSTYYIQSPGHITFRAAIMTPIVLVVLLALLSAPGAEATQPKNVVVINSASTGKDTCLPIINNTVQQTLQMIGLSAWQEACSRHRALEQSAKIRIDPTIAVRDNSGGQ